MKYLLLILLAFAGKTASAQKMPDDYFEEANNFLENKEYDKAVASYQYIITNHPRNEIYPRACFNLGYTFFTQKKYDRAIPVFAAIMKSGFNEKERLGSGLMDDPFTNYRHRASEILSSIYQQKKMYDTALYYLSLADSVYPYLHFCGNEYAASAISTALKYADIYKHLNKPEQAISALLPVVFETLANNEKVIAQLELLLKNRKGLKKDLDQAIHTIYSREVKNEDHSYNNYYLKFLDTEIPVSPYYERNKEEAVKEMEEGAFYKMIRDL